MEKIIKYVWLLIFLPSSLVAQVTIWSEDFDTIPNGTQQNSTRWTTMHTNMNGTGFWGVASGEFWVNGMEGQNYSCNNFWWSEVINISQFYDVIVSYDIRGAAGGTGFECDGTQYTDLVESSYRVDGGVWTRFCENGYICTGSNGFQTVVKQEDLAGNTLEIRIRLGNKAVNEDYWFDNILVTGEINPSAPYPGTDTIIRRCNGDSLLIGGQFRKQSGRYVLNLTNQFGCDSIAAIGLIIDSVKNTTVTDSICKGDSLLLGGNYQKTSGIYVDSLQTSIGCDSLVTTQLTVLSLGGDTLDVPICKGDSFLVNDTYRKVAGFYNDTVSRAGCDSVSIINLIVNPTFSFIQSFSICKGDSMLVNGRYLKSTGIFKDTLASIKGCDSVIITNLIAHLNYNQTIKDTICNGDSIYLENRYRFNPGTYKDTFQTAFGCDSMVTTQLTVIQPAFGSDVYTICQGDSILVGGQYRKTAGFFSDTINSIFTGCDSINLIQLNVNTRNFLNQQLTICQGDSVLINGIYRKTEGTYNDTATGVCGDITIYNIVTNPAYYIQLNNTICQGDSIYLEGAYQKQNGIYIDTLLSSNGCDSILITNLSIVPSFSISNSASICYGDSIFLAGAFKKRSGVYNDSLVSTGGCDSIVSTTLAVYSSYYDLIDTVICPQDSFFFMGGYIKAAGTYFDSLQTSLGCDSVTELRLSTIYKDTTVIPRLYICKNDSIFFNNQYINQEGVYFDTLASIDGCDSLVKQELRQITVSLNKDTLSICGEDSALLYGEWQSTEGLYIDTIRTTNGSCDSVINQIYLHLLDDYFIETTLSICEGNSIQIYGVNRTVAGTYNDTIQASNGCDSILSTTLIVYQNKQVRKTERICEGDTVVIAGSPRYEPGDYLENLVSAEGCDSIVITELKVTPAPKRSVQFEACTGDTVRWNGNIVTQNKSFTIKKPASGSCDSLIITTINFIDVVADFEFNQLNPEVERINFKSKSMNVNIFNWNFGDSSEKSSEPNPTHFYSAPRSYLVTLIAQNDFGCIDSIQRRIEVISKDTLRLFIPEIFTPNNDGVNDFFEVGYTGDFAFEISVFNRWGELLFNRKNINFKWDGRYKGDIIPNGTYFYVVSGKFYKKGSITVLR